MKFGKTYEKTLEEQHIPLEWIENSIQYKPLKKKINKVVDELDCLGLSQKFIQHKAEFHYTFDEDKDSLTILPKLNTTQLNDIKLENDKEFFQSLYTQYLKLLQFNHKEQLIILKKIKELAIIIKKLITKKHSDMYLWRDIFNQYIGFKLDLNSKFTLQNMNNFLQHINDTKLIQNSKHTKSNTKIFQQFFELNKELIKFMTFENLNSMAIRKIIKKFDKHTMLKSSKSFKLILTGHESLSPLATNTIEQIISQDIIKIIPQLEDYNCAICFSIAYRPIRLRCSHFFCLRCMIKLQRKDERKCPICREEAVLDADGGNLDLELEEKMKKWFPKEVKEKKKDNGKEFTYEALGRMYGEAVCLIV